MVKTQEKVVMSQELLARIVASYVDQSETEFKLDPVTETEVYKYLSDVKPTKSTGYYIWHFS